VPSAGWSAASTIRHAVVVLADVRAPRERLVGESAARGGRPARRASRSCAAASASSSIASGATFEHNEQRRRSELLHDVELGLGARQRARELVGRHALDVAQRLVEVDREAEAGGALPDLGGRQRHARRSGSNSSIPSKPARAAAASFLLERASSADRATERRTARRPYRGTRRRRSLDERGEVAQHALAVGARRP